MGRLNLKNGSAAQRDGAKAERMVMWYLVFRGYRLLEHNYTVGHKEIDLIMRKRGTIAFVEVKARRKIDGRFPPHLSVDAVKRKNIVSAAKVYVLREKLSGFILRFDVAEVDLSSRRINYIRNAYTEG
ncbi:MAG: YraN family protein [Eubacteriales bacterium]|nr:YraN family protein [Eubacteriales bacterium]MDD6018480.1 YraN family protein [Clostridiales bacterium]MDD7488182.1 YraN family protein [Clostridiales bacterium]MDY3308338.1 YraN family protein [Eubacteriales bacterium]MDY5702971.1 YraN family protein [Eubacteriales bacterium]